MKKTTFYKYTLTFILVFTSSIAFLSCHKNESIVFDTPFISIESLNAASAGPISSEQEFVGEYMIYLNAPYQSDNVDITYDISIGDGLIEGRDYQFLTEGNTKTFISGIYELPFRIKWLRTCMRNEDKIIISDALDDTKDTNIKITLLQNSKNFGLGYPGPDNLKKEIIIKKIKAK